MYGHEFFGSDLRPRRPHSFAVTLNLKPLRHAANQLSRLLPRVTLDGRLLLRRFHAKKPLRGSLVLGLDEMSEI